MSSVAVTASAPASAPVSAPAAATSNSVPDDTNFVQDGKSFFPVGEKKHIFVVPDVFRGKVYVNIREYFVENHDDEDDTDIEQDNTRPYYKPTKSGICLNVKEFEKLCQKIEKTKTAVKRLLKRVEKTQKKKTKGNQQD